jgi:hypothetical protein
MSLTVGDTSVFSGKIYTGSVDSAGSINVKYKSLSNNILPYNVLSTDSFLIFDTNSQSLGFSIGRTISLPSSSSDSGMLLRVANVLGFNSKKITVSNQVNGQADFKIYNNEIAEFYLSASGWVLTSLFYKENVVFNSNNSLVITDETTVVSSPASPSVWTHTLPSVDDFSTNKTLNIKNIGTGSITVNTAALSETIDGVTSITLTAKKSAILRTIYDSGSSTYKWYLIQ